MRRAIALLLALMTTVMLAGCARKENNNYTEINPESGAASKDSAVVSLYFGNSTSTYLVAETRTIDVPVNARMDKTILETLIKGPSADNTGMVALINRATQIVSISESADVLIITLSRDFLNWDENATVYSKYLGVYSIVNTLVEVSGYARVQLLVDTDNSGTGQKLQRSDVGIEGDGALDTLGWNGDIVLSPGKTVSNIFEAVKSKDFSTAYGYIAHENGTPDVTDFQAYGSESKYTLESFTVGEVIVGGDGTKATVMADYTIRDQSGNQNERTNIPVMITREKYIWKISYNDFKAMFFEEQT